MRRPVPEPAGTADASALFSFSFGSADGFASAVAGVLGRLVDAVGFVPWSAWTPRTATTAIAPVVSPVTQAHEGRRAGTGTHLLGVAEFRPLEPGARSSYCPVCLGSPSRAPFPSVSAHSRPRSSTGSSSGRWPSEARAACCRSSETSPYRVVRGLAGRPAASATAIRSLTDLYEP